MSNIQIPEEKQQRIVRAAMENFARNGYRKATMDEIVAAAGISKGLIFHYYGSKEKLFLHLYEFAYGFVYERLVPHFNHDEPDLFERIRLSEKIKIDMMKQYPYILDFLMTARQEDNPELQRKMKQLSRENYPAWSDSFQKGIDTSKLRDGIELERVIRIIQWCTNGLLAEYKDGFVLEEVFAEMDIYLDLMKRAFYKEEHQ